MQTDKINSSPVTTPESIKKNISEALERTKVPAGELQEGAVSTESIKELPVYKLHASFEGVFFVKAATPLEAKAKLLELSLKGNVKEDHITLLEAIPYDQYKDFKVEIID